MTAKLLLRLKVFCGYDGLNNRKGFEELVAAKYTEDLKYRISLFYLPILYFFDNTPLLFRFRTHLFTAHKFCLIWQVRRCFRELMDLLIPIP